MSDGELASSARGGDEEASEVLYRRYMPAALRVARSIWQSDYAEAFAAADDAFLDAIRLFDESRGSFGGFLDLLVRQKATDSLRRWDREHARGGNEPIATKETLEEDTVDAAWSTDSVASWRHIERFLDREALHCAIDAAVRFAENQAEPQRTRMIEALTNRLAMLSGQPYLTGAELAALLDCDPSQVTRAWQTLLGIMSRALQEDC